MVQLVHKEGEVECSTWTWWSPLLEVLDDKDASDLVWGCWARFHEWWDPLGDCDSPLAVSDLETGLVMECWTFWTMKSIKGGAGIGREGGEWWGEISRPYDAWKYDPRLEELGDLRTWKIVKGFWWALKFKRLDWTISLLPWWWCSPLSIALWQIGQGISKWTPGETGWVSTIGWGEEFLGWCKVSGLEPEVG